MKTHQCIAKPLENSVHTSTTRTIKE